MEYRGDVKRCPFCGSTNLSFEQENVGPMRIRCGSCGATGPHASSKATDVVAKWNTRVNSEPIRMVIKE